MPKTKIPLDRGPVLLAGGGILRLTLLNGRNGRPRLLVEHTGEISWDLEARAMSRKPRKTKARPCG